MSEAPPYYRPMQPKKNKNTVLIVVLVCVVLIPCIGLIALLVAGIGLFKNTIAPVAACMFTLEATSKSIEEYKKEKGVYPHADKWQDQIKDLYQARLNKNKDKFGPFTPSPPGQPLTCKFGDAQTGFAFNDDLSGKKVVDIKNPSSTVMLFEVEKFSLNAHGKYVARQTKDSPKIMGDPRGWIQVMADGEVSGMKGNNSSIKID